ncbi:MAG: hypothetical protein A2342_02845 [Gallionellales bacterium RIFOXYB12_FULL_54_9]|nr:MAG: hypothetical protein A2342_02845 [Gallionellales bacterium RIFOXYB12_FULL_54_9]
MRVILDIKDDGPGVPAANQARLFEPFFTTADQGTGLGLYIARELCEANGAQLEYHTPANTAGHPSAGAVFRIIFGEYRRQTEPQA